MKIIDEISARQYIEALQQETDSLLAAGFSKERIEWLRAHTDELDASRRQKDTERRQKGLPVNDPNEVLAYIYDNDLDLAKEIGNAEYERYREALGRANSIKIASVRRGGIADNYGLKAGDEIIRYDGRRVYNIAEVNSLARKQSRPGESVNIEVLRDGRPVVLTILRGDLGIDTPLPIGPRSRALRSAVREQSGRQ